MKTTAAKARAARVVASERGAGKRIRVTAGLFLGLALATLGIVGVSPAQAGIPSMTRAEIIARAESGIGTMYGWGRESWIPNQGGGTGPDCSGFTLKCWEVPRTLLYQEEDSDNASIVPRYTSYEFFNCLGPWTRLGDRSELREGDVLVKNNGTSGHVVIYAGGDAWNSPIIYEAPGTGLTIRRTSRYLGSEYQPRRRYSLIDSGIILDNPSAKTIGGTDLGGNWARSTSSPGYSGDGYQVQAATTATAWARWTPRLPTSGYYNIYLRWTSDPNRASSVQVNVNTPSGQYKRYVNQRASGGTWYSLGRYNFNAGYNTGSGSISVWATGANGYVVADAVKFEKVQ